MKPSSLNALACHLDTSKKDGAFGIEYPRDITDMKGDQEAGRFVVLHLRFDREMVAHLVCDFSGGNLGNIFLSEL